MLLAIKIVAAIYLILLVLVFMVQRKMLYHPDISPLSLQLQEAKENNFEPWQTPSGTRIGWKQISKNSTAHARLLILHGNPGSAIHRLDYARGLQSVEPFDVYILEYPGYGGRDGAPTQQSLIQAATEAVELLKKEGPLYLMGESLGTGVAAYLAGTYPQLIHGLVLIAPYNRLTDVAQNHMPIFPVKLMLWDKFPSDSYLQNYHGPIGILLAGRDTVIPAKFGRKLFEGYAGPKQLWETPLAGHNDLLDQPASLWKELLAFWKSNLKN